MTDSNPNEISSGKGSVENRFIYTQQYFDYHRNLTLLFLATIVTTIFKAQINLGELAYISGASPVLSKIIPVFFWIAGIYSWANFKAEWDICARPHRSRMVDAARDAANTSGRLIIISETISGLTESAIKQFKSMLDDANYRLAQSNLAMLSSEYSQRLKDDFSKIVSENNLSWDALQQELDAKASQLNRAIAGQLDGSEIPRETSDAIYAETSGAFSATHVWFNSFVSIINEKICDQSQNYQKEFNQINFDGLTEFGNSHNYFASAAKITSSLSKWSSEVEVLKGQIKSAKSLAKKDKVAALIKADFSGRLVPWTLFIISTLGMVDFFGIFEFTAFF